MKPVTQAQMPKTHNTTPFTKTHQTVKLPENNTIGADLEWIKIANLVDKPILFCQAQLRHRAANGKYAEHDEFVLTFRLDDESDEPLYRLSSSNMVIVKQIMEFIGEGGSTVSYDDVYDLSLVAYVRERTGKSSSYYYLEPYTPPSEDFPF